MRQKKTGLVIINLGTPDKPSRAAVYRYLREFLTDRRVVNFPWFVRQLLVQGIIAPFRSGPSSKVYQKVWTEDGSPLKVYGLNLAQKVQERVPEHVIVKLAMRYQNPSIEKVLKELLDQNIDELIVFPLFPQYASATTGSIFEEVMRILKKEYTLPAIQFIQSYPIHKDMIQLFADNARSLFDLDQYDHILFSFHGLPVSQLFESDNNSYCRADGKCCETRHEKNKFCYSAQCYDTARAIAEELGLSKKDYTICYQSRLGPTKWLQPYTSDVLEDLANNGSKKVLTFCPAFVADCLETTIEIGEEYKEDFENNGGEVLDLVPSLNDSDQWADIIVSMIQDQVTSMSHAKM